MADLIKNYFSKVPTVNFCEAPNGTWIARPGYFISNFSYLFLGFYLFFKKGLARQFSYFVFLIGLMSSVYDATYRLWAQHLDLLAMFIFISFLAELNYQIIFKSTKFSRLIQFGLPTFSIFLIFITGFSSGQILFAIFTIITLISYFYLPIRKTLNYNNLYLAVIFLIIGFLAWIPDRLQSICFDLTIFNGRAIFHYLTTFTIFFVYKFYAENKLVVR